jgi:hypothetical protein
MKLAIDWTKHIKDPEAKEQFIQSLQNNKVLGLRLLDMIDEWIRELDTSEISMGIYDSPSWSHKQAHINGAKNAFASVKKHLQFLKGE